MKRDLTVYVASAWWRDCDPHTGVVALTAEAAEKAIEDAIRQSAEDAASDEWCVCGEEVTDDNEDEHKGCGIDAQAWSGVFPESLRSILDSMETRWDGGERGRYQQRDTLENLRAYGVAYLETP